MSSPWRIVDLTGFEGTVRAGQGVLTVGEISVPLADISVILSGLGGLYHPSVVDRAAAFEIPILHCDWRGVPIATTLGWNDGSRVAARHRAQATLDLPRGKNAWMRIVKAKIRGQAANLESFDQDGFRRLIDLSTTVRSGDPSNVEGHAARLYWPRLFENKSFRRMPQSRKALNGMLDYGYTILRGASVRAVLTAGLWPTMGIWHHQRDNCFALADDLIEPFRPVIDALVQKMAETTHALDKEAKHRLAGSMEQTLTGKGYTVSSEITRFAQQLARYIEGEVKILEVPVFAGLDED